MVREVHDAVGTSFQEREATPQISAITIPSGSNLEPVGSSERLSLPFQSSAFGVDSVPNFEEVQSGGIRAEIEEPGCPAEEMPKPIPSQEEAYLLEDESA